MPYESHLDFIYLHLGYYTDLSSRIRHVLQEMTVDTFIPNDTKILDEGGFDELALPFNKFLV